MSKQTQKIILNKVYNDMLKDNVSLTNPSSNPNSNTQSETFANFYT